MDFSFGSGQRFDQLKKQNEKTAEAPPTTQRMQLVGGGEIEFTAPAGADERTKILAAQAELKKKGLDRKLVVDVKDPKANLSGMDLSGCTLTGKMPAKMENTNCEKATFYKIGGPTQAAGANFKGATFQDVNMDNSHARGANFENVTMRNVSAINLDAQKSNWTGAQASGIKLTGAKLQEAQFGDTHFENADMAHADLSGSKGSVNMTRAQAHGIKVTHANLSVMAPNADLAQADFKGTPQPKARQTHAPSPF